MKYSHLHDTNDHEADEKVASYEDAASPSSTLLHPWNKLAVKSRFPCTMDWRLMFELVLAVLVLLPWVFVLQFKLPDLAPGATDVYHIPPHSVDWKESFYWHDPQMFRNRTLFDQMMPRFQELSSDARGFVGFDDWRALSLPPPQKVDLTEFGRPGQHGESYTIAYFHQIHCIAKITRIYADARSTNDSMEGNDLHMAHCLDVLRQAVMCFSDTTLEDGQDGWEVTHQCRDHRKLIQWADARAVFNWTEVIGAGRRIDVP